MEASVTWGRVCRTASGFEGEFTVVCGPIHVIGWAKTQGLSGGGPVSVDLPMGATVTSDFDRELARQFRERVLEVVK